MGKLKIIPLSGEEAEKLRATMKDNFGKNCNRAAVFNIVESFHQVGSGSC